jgi:hypothetical protein
MGYLYYIYPIVAEAFTPKELMKSNRTSLHFKYEINMHIQFLTIIILTTLSGSTRYMENNQGDCTVKNEYNFGDSVKNRLRQHYEHFQKKDSSFKSTCFLVIRSYKNDFTLTYSHAPDSALAQVIMNRNSFVKVDEGVYVPMISEIDLYFNSVLNDGNSRRVDFFDGPFIIFSYGGKLLDNERK